MSFLKADAINGPLLGMLVQGYDVALIREVVPGRGPSIQCFQGTTPRLGSDPILSMRPADRRDFGSVVYRRDGQIVVMQGAPRVSRAPNFSSEQQTRGSLNV